MKIKQISVFLENRKGRLSDICSMLGTAGVNIRALTIAETETFGVLRMVVDKPAAAMEVFRTHSVTANQTEVVAVEVPDTPGGLAKVLNILTDNDLNVEYMYGFVEKFSEIRCWCSASTIPKKPIRRSRPTASTSSANTTLKAYRLN